ncbi:MAG: hypothetical protein SGJ27_27940 [Candidatus Melainabacteria bacterium]|nr:hypothetical protein [Candidatus Melainabacteria bacterium]
MSYKRPTIDGIPLPDPTAIEHQRRRDQPQPENRIQPSVHDIREEGYRRYIEEQQHKPVQSDRGVTIINIGGDDDE